MLDRRVIALTREIRDLYAQSSVLANRYNAGLAAEQEELRRACRGRTSRVRELNYFDNAFDRAEAIKRATSDPGIQLRMHLIHGVFWVIIVLVTWHCLTLTGTLPLAACVALILAIGAYFIHERYVVGSDPFRRLLRKQLAAQGVPVCVECGYDLRGQAEARCPECGHVAPIASPPGPPPLHPPTIPSTGVIHVR